MTEPTAAPTSLSAAPAFCADCGTANQPGHAFCVSCGTRMVVDLTGPVIPTQSAPGNPSVPVALGADAMPPSIPAPRESWPEGSFGQPQPGYAEQPYAEQPHVEQAYAQPYVEQAYVEQAYVEQAYAQPIYPDPAYAPQAYADPAYAPGYLQPAYLQPGYVEPTQLGRLPALQTPRPRVDTPLLPHGWVPASFGQRVGARLIDYVIVSGLAVLLDVGIGLLTAAMGITTVGAGFLIGALLMIFFLPSLISVVYRVSSDFGLGRSLGRAAVGIRLVKLPSVGPDVALPPSDELARVGFGTVLGRLIVGGLGDCLFFLNSLSVLWDAQQRSWGDKVANTAVVVDHDGEKRSAWTPPAIAATLCAVLAFGLVLLSNTGPSFNDVASSYGGTSGSTYDTPSYSPPSYSAPSAPSGGTDGNSPYSTPSYSPPSYSAPTYAPPTSDSSSGGVTFSAKENLVVRTGSDRSSSQVMTVLAGQSVTIVCQTHGEQVEGDHGASDLWDKIVAPVPGYVSDEYVYTGTTGTDAQVAPLCS